jgi:hypothetical protein
MTSPPTVRRNALGHWLPGSVPNPGGRPSVVKEIAELAHANAPAAFTKLLELMEHKDGRVQFQAASLILAYAYGKPTERVQAEVTTLNVAQMWKNAVEAASARPPTIEATPTHIVQGMPVPLLPVGAPPLDVSPEPQAPKAPGAVFAQVAQDAASSSNSSPRPGAGARKAKKEGTS